MHPAENAKRKLYPWLLISIDDKCGEKSAENFNFHLN